ncbi:MAG: hypothetical protein JW860_10635 [Sedimentisphaerales bacterium]|nr:hypothetical protein [Sedimentisphaerales bacterium]
MNRKYLLQIRSIAVYVFTAMLYLCPIARGDNFTIPEVKLLDSEFSATNWGGTLTQTDALGNNVLFTFAGLSSSSTGVKDDYPVDTIYGQIIPSHANGDFTNFEGFILRFENLDADPVSVSLFINTGFTGPSGTPPSDPANNTFWQSPWTQLAPGESRVLRLDFDNATPWEISDNPEPHTQGTNGQATAINAFDRAEVSAIGFQAYASSNPVAPILAEPAFDPYCTTPIPEDTDGNCRVDLNDFALLAANWLTCNLEPPDDCW